MARGSIRKRGRVYYVRYYIGGQLKEKAIGTNKHEAERILIEIMREIHRGQYTEIKRITFADFACKWLADYVQGRVRPSTFKSYSDTMRLHLVPRFDQMNLTSITARDIDEYIAYKQKDSKLAAASIEKHLIVLKMMFKRAIIWSYATGNPAEYIKRPRSEKKEMQIIAPDEIQAFLNAVNPEFYPFFATAVFTGLRLGELRALKWSDINFATSQLHVRRSYVLGRFQEPKTRAGIRAVIMPPFLVNELRQYKLRQSPVKLDLVFPDSKGNPIDDSNLRNREFYPALRRARLHRIRFHDLRHTYTSLLIASGENLKFIQQQLGHGSIQVTLDRYGHLIPAVQHGAGERLEKMVFGKDMGKTWAKAETAVTSANLVMEKLVP